MTDGARRVAPIARLAAAHDALSRLGFDVAAGCLGVIVCSYCYEVVSRYFFNAPTIWAGPLVAYMLCALVFLAAPDITRKNTSHRDQRASGEDDAPTSRISAEDHRCGVCRRMSRGRLDCRDDALSLNTRRASRPF